MGYRLVSQMIYLAVVLCQRNQLNIQFLDETDIFTYHAIT